MVEINNLTTKKIDEEFLRKVAEMVLKEEGKKKLGLSIALVGQGRMRELNRKYRGKNRVTDVLAFGTKTNLQFILPTGKTEVGEVVICPKEVKKNAKRFHSAFKEEIATCLIHGILHLLGYNHEKNEKKAKEMEKKQQYYLSKILNT